MTTPNIERLRERIQDPDPQLEGIGSTDFTEDRDRLLAASRTMRRHKGGKRGWGEKRHHSVLQRLIVLCWGGQKYDVDDMHGTTLSASLEDTEAAGKIVDWIHTNYDNEETNRDMRNALRTFGKILTNEDPTHKDASPPPSIDWISATTSATYDPAPNPSQMITWEETKKMSDHPQTNPRDAALLTVAWDSGLRSGELEELQLRDVNDHDMGKSIRVRNGKTGTRNVTITNAVPYLRQWLNGHPATDVNGNPNDLTAPLWSKLKSPTGISYRSFRDIFANAADRVNLEQPNNPTNFRKSSASALASEGVPQAHLEKRFGWNRGSDAASRYISIFGEDADRVLAKARGMDIEVEPAEPIGPVRCYRCSEFINRHATTCDNCGAIQDRKKAQDAIPVDGQQANQIIRGAVQEEINDLLSDSSSEDLSALLGVSKDIEESVHAHINQEIDEAIEDALRRSKTA